MKFRLLLLLILFQFSVRGQDEALLKTQVRHTIDELVQFIAIPNDALEHADINRNLTWLTRAFSERGFNTSILPTEEESLFFAALPMEDGKPTLLWYMHFDGQPWTLPNGTSRTPTRWCSRRLRGRGGKPGR